jgi:hypothetical protein
MPMVWMLAVGAGAVVPSPVCLSAWPEPALRRRSARAFLLFVRRSVEVAQLCNVLNQGGAVESQLEYATHVVLCRDVTSLYANLSLGP